MRTLRTSTGFPGGHTSVVASANVELARSILTAWEQGDYRSAEWAGPDVSYEFPDAPVPGPFHGTAGLADGWREFFSAWEDFRTIPEEYVELDAERVLVWVRFGGRGRASGLDISQLRAGGAIIFHISDGKARRVICYMEADNARTELGLGARHDVD